MAAPIKIGMYYFARMMTSKSTPVVLTLSPERITVASTDAVLLDAAPSELTLKHGKVAGTLTLKGASGKTILAALGSNSAASFTQQQIDEITSAQQAAAQDPVTGQIRLAHQVWIGRPNSVDGSYSPNGPVEAVTQSAVGGAVADVLLMAGVRQG